MRPKSIMSYREMRSKFLLKSLKNPEGFETDEGRDSIAHSTEETFVYLKIKKFIFVPRMMLLRSRGFKTRSFL